MKLCIVTHSVAKGSGQGRVNYEIALEAIRRGHHVTLITSHIAPELETNQQVRSILITLGTIPSALLRNLIFSWLSSRWLEHHRSELDLVQINGAITHAPSDVNAVHFVHSSWLKSSAHTIKHRQDFYGIYQWLYTALNAYWEKKALRRTQVVVAVSEKVKQELLALGLPHTAIRVILNGVDLDEFYPGLSERKILGLPEHVPLALFVGDLQTPRKNLETVLQTLVQIPSLHLAVVGTTDGSIYPSVAKGLGVSSRVHFLDYRRDIPDIMRSSDVLIFPSRYEACTLVLLEALASGLPVITATTAGGAEVITPACGFVLAGSEDISTLVKVTQQMVNDPVLREDMGKAARRVAEQYAWLTMAKSYVDLFEEMTS